MNTISQSLVITLLTAARASLWNGEGEYTLNHNYACIEVERAADALIKAEEPKTTEYLRAVSVAALSIKANISAYMEDFYTYDAYWAKKNNINTFDLGYNHREHALAIQAGRAEMLDALLVRAQQIAILQLASTRVWDGENYGESGPTKAEFMCHAITYAAIDVLNLTPEGKEKTYQGEAMYQADKLEAVKVLHADIERLIVGYPTARSYYENLCMLRGESFSDIKLQAFRKSHLESMLTTYVEKAVK